MSAKIEKIKVYEDGNWVAYGEYGQESDKRTELARGKGECPYTEGQELNTNGKEEVKPKAETKFEHDYKNKIASNPAKAREEVNPRQYDARARALGCAIAYFGCADNSAAATYRLDWVLATAEDMEAWLLRKEGE